MEQEVITQDQRNSGKKGNNGGYLFGILLIFLILLSDGYITNVLGGKWLCLLKELLSLRGTC